ncbi:MAG: hypothetical protein FWC36_00970 [Spirochaetes bacterium]|nr:hypothetical protein [Spirochaetota bacterium]
MKVVLITFVIAAGLFFPVKAYSQSPADQTQAQRALRLEYNIIRIENSPQGRARRFTYHVVVPPGTTKSDMEQIALRVLERAKRENPFNALAVGFYDHARLVGHGFRFGRVEFAPNGRWADAATVRTGDYSLLRMVSHLREPDWDNALTRREATIFARHSRTLNSLLRRANTQKDIEKAEKEAARRVMKRFNISQEELSSIFSRYHR